jgi:hypothetical protein
MCFPNSREGVDEQVESLLWFEPANRPNDDLPVRHAKAPARVRDLLGIAPNRSVIDPIQQHAHTIGSASAGNEIGFHLA